MSTPESQEAATSVRVPPAYVGPLARLRDLPSRAFEALARAIETAADPPTRSDLVRSIRDALDEDDASAISLTDALVSVRTLQGRSAWDAEMAGAAVASADQFADAPDSREQLAARLTRILSSPAITAVAKANDVAFANSRTFQDARIITEIRPIFADDIGDPLLGAVIVHNLEVNYIQDGDYRRMYAALDDDDLAQLAAVAERAQEKARTIRKTLESAGLKLLDYGA